MNCFLVQMYYDSVENNGTVSKVPKKTRNGIIVESTMFTLFKVDSSKVEKTGLSDFIRR